MAGAGVEIIESVTALPSAGWHARVLRLAVPIVLANLTQPLLSAADTAIAGHFPGMAALGGVALGGVFFNFVFWGCGFLRMGTTGLVAQAYGAGDQAGLRAVLLRALGLGFAIGAAILVLQVPLVHLALALLGGGAAVKANATAYCLARIWSAPAALGNYVVLGSLLGRQRPRLALLLQAVINLSNLVVALALVYGLGWGIAGLGGATAAADWIGLAVGAVLLRRLHHRGLPPVDWRAILASDALLRLLRVNSDIFLRTLCLLGAFGWFAHQGAGLGDAVLAANALLLNFQTFMALGLDGFAHAAEALVGAAIGAGDRHGFRMALKVTSQWAGAIALCFAATYALAGGTIIRLLTDQPAVRAVALAYLPWAAASPLVSVWSFELDGVFIGAMRTREMRNGMAVALVGFLGGVALLEPRLGNAGLWASLMIFMVLRAAVLGGFLGRIDRALATVHGGGRTDAIDPPATTS